jgi:hypothetical protein
MIIAIERAKSAQVATAHFSGEQLTLNHTLDFKSDAQTTGPLSQRNPATDFARDSRFDSAGT